ncbi:MAG: Crp/Fnr family transcriptional regulator [Candidatus Pseudobacter hemicellulosilyticus]|uniref:Crp/Fnr family transcriptional regulator n=1 Tax=Candidatus Pseudobacter hemicellulosilyticus TaxID=3121375 RepID=A0AAJ5WQV2_9BACT|nr:MAG: Crp/Fnr family transcriptional regulator [Pseudobacter sp.]
MEIAHILDALYPLPEPSRQRIIAHVREIQLPKGHILFRAGKVETKICFIKKGIVRAFAEAGDHEITFWFGQEGDPVVSMNSYVDQQKGYENIELLEDAVLYELPANSLQELYLTDIHIANWGRKFAERELIKTEERLISRQFGTAADRYRDLLNNHPDLIRRVPLGHIASYLGITQVSLSRIRAAINR